MNKHLLLLLSAGALSAPTLAQPAGPWTPAAMISYQRVSTPVVSPDGKRVAYVVASARTDGENSDYLSHIHVAGADGKADHQFTFGDKACTDPQFSPDGQYLAFVAARGKDKDAKKQLLVLRLTGGEAEPLTNAKNNISSYAWSPDGKRLAYVVTDARSAQEEKDRREKKDWDVVDQTPNAHLYTVTLARNARGEHPARQLTKGAFHLTGLDWSPDGRTVVFAQQSSPSANAWSSSKIATVPADSGAVRVLAVDKGSATQPHYSPDGRHIAYVADYDKSSWMRQSSVYLISVADGSIRQLAATPDELPGIVGWSPDNRAVIVTEALRTGSAVYRLPADGAAPKRLTPLTTGLYTAPHLNQRGDLAYLYQTTDTPPEVHLASLSNPAGRRLTRVYADYQPGSPLAKTEVLTWKAPDGKFDIDGLLTYPLNYVPGRRYPLVLNVHGGPAGVFAQSYTGAGGTPYPIQALAQQGYFVLRPNPRGSSGYGAAFRRANFRDWGGADYDDLMAGVDQTIARGLAHPDSLVETGWSYGGYMTATIITKTTRFKAVMAGAPVTNLVSFNGTADIADFLPSYFGGEFWEDPQVYAEHSPMLAIKNAKTPTLIIHGLADDRVPPEQGYQLHRALQRLGVKTQMVTYPRQPHGFTEPKFNVDVAERTIAWFNTHLGRSSSPAPSLRATRQEPAPVAEKGGR